MNADETPQTGTSTTPARPQPPAAESAARRWTLGFFLFAMGVAGVGFSVKLVEFADDLTAEHGLQFAGAHLLTYGLIAAGFLMLLVLCFLRGHFKDVEEPKYDLLEKERRYDARLPRV